MEGRHSPSAVQVTGAALTLAQLFEDFVTGSHLADVPVDWDDATAMELGLDTKRCSSEVCMEGDMSNQCQGTCFTCICAHTFTVHT